MYKRYGTTVKSPCNASIWPIPRDVNACAEQAGRHADAQFWTETDRVNCDDYAITGSVCIGQGRPHAFH